MACPDCDSLDVKSTKQERKEGMFPAVYFLDVVLFCNHCGLGWHCVGTKQINTSDSEV